MNPVVKVLLALAALCALIAVAAWRFLRGPAAETAQFDREIEQFGGSHNETTATQALPPLPAEDLVGPDTNGDPGSETPPSGAVPQNVSPADPGGSAAAADAPPQRLTPKQRKRALHKGRIPRNLPGLDGRRTAGSALQTAVTTRNPQHQTGGLDLAGHVSRPAPVPGEHHERIPRPMLIWDGRWVPVFPTLLESARHEAHFRQWETEMAAMIDGAYAWLETAA